MPRVTRLVACAAAPSHDERVRGVAVGVAPGLEVVAGPDRVEARLLRRDREVEQALRRELLRGRLVAEAQGGHGLLGVAGRRDGRRFAAVTRRDRADGVGRRTRSAQRATASAAAPTSTSTEPASRSATSRRPVASPQPDDAPGGGQDDRRLAQRRDDRERGPAERRRARTRRRRTSAARRRRPWHVERLVGRRERARRRSAAGPTRSRAARPRTPATGSRRRTTAGAGWTPTRSSAE